MKMPKAKFSKIRWISIGSSFLFVLIIIEIVFLSPQVVDVREPQLDLVSDLMDESTEEMVEQVMNGVHLVETIEGKKEWELWSKQAINFKDSGDWKLNGVKVIFFSEKGDYYTVTGNEGKILSGSKNLSISGKVLVQSLNGYKYSTKEVSYNSKSRSLISENPIEMLGPRDNGGYSFFLKGNRMEADLVSSMMTIEGNINSRRNFSNGRVVRISSEKARFSGKNYFSKFIENVVLDSNGMRITGPEATFVFKKGSDEISSVLVDGGVKVSDANKWATSNSLSAFFDENKFVFKGSPRVVQDADELRGDEIIFLEGGKKVKVLKGKANMDKKSVENIN